MMSDGRKRLSGAQYKKLKIKKHEEMKKCTSNISQFFPPKLSSPDGIQEPTPSTSKNIDEKLEQMDIQTADSIFNNSEQSNSESEHSISPAVMSSGNSVGEVLDDPGAWPEVLTDKVRVLLVEKGISHLRQNEHFCYPTDASNRSFSNNYYRRKLTNGEIIHRSWLMYSIKKDAVFCFPCKLFANKYTLLGQDGYKDWQHLSRTLSRHEINNDHIKYCNQLAQLQNSLHSDVSVNSLQEKLIVSERKRWCYVLERIVIAIQYLAKQNQALRGSSNKLFRNDNGNFLQLIEAFSKFDSVMAEHLRKIQIHQNYMPHYLGEKIQNQVLTIVGENIKKNIKAMLYQAKYYSIILDCTPDISHQEQITVILRFAFLNKDNKHVEIREHFLGFCQVQDTTGSGLCQFVINFLEKENINIQDMRGQGYDNGANMKGKNNGLQRHILNINPRAFFVPCAAHTLNLVVNDSAKASNEVVNFFSIVQALYVFFSSSTQRWHVLQKYVKNLTLKPLSDTRWESRVEALKPLKYFLPEIYDALCELSLDLKRDPLTRNEANSLGRKIKSFKFICSVLIWYEILTKVNVVSKLLQGTNLYMVDCLEELETLEKYFREKRTDTEFENFIESATSIANDFDIEPGFEAGYIPLRTRSKKRQFDYEAQDEPIIDYKTSFKVNFFYSILDTTIMSINERFTLLRECSAFSFLHDISKLSNVDVEVIRKHCMDLQLKLTDDSTITNDRDINALELADEIITILPFIRTENLKKPVSILEYIFKNELMGTFPNIFIALRILLTMPISVASGERSFSKLKLIKNYLRSTMSQERLNNLAFISIETDESDKLNINEIVRDFANMKARKVNFI